MTLLLLRPLPAQKLPAPGDAFDAPTARIALHEQDVVDGVSILARDAGLAVSVEFPLGTSISKPAPELSSLTAEFGPGQLSKVIDELCSSDPTFTWVRYGNTINLFPRALAEDPHYLLNRKIDSATLRDVSGVQEAIFKVVEQLPEPKEQIAVMLTGTSSGFPRPWTTTLTDITVREAFDRIAGQLSPTGGWQLSGAQDFRVITFHTRILPKPSRRQPGRPSFTESR